MRAIDPGQDPGIRIEEALAEALARACTGHAPPLLAAAYHHAVFPGGARIRPRLTLSVAAACGDDRPALANAAAAAIELLHCASLVHDDMPCFDDADMRRGKASAHLAFGEPLALLAGDGLIILGFQTLAMAGGSSAERALQLTMILARATGMPGGIVAGQAWESEPEIDLVLYQQAKTGSLFAGAAMAGAAAAGQPHEPWAGLGYRLGEAFQVADDIRDVCATQEEVGKPIGKDDALGRPNAVKALGLKGAVRRLASLIDETIEAVPDCPGREALRHQIQRESARFLPASSALLPA
ncbi:geranylgeranyl pyrophosphate synthase [Rhizobium albus]|nr:geranylgeranyl pyrophosphate synthase [Rhizobium albus]